MESVVSLFFLWTFSQNAESIEDPTTQVRILDEQLWSGVGLGIF
ncbi:hypothetical protein GLYMA_12G191550v4 [Glycine max]|nr:hypothetical protein GLYMA_12G191550v4 [Glycine max]KAH1143933.1 hypothetical protein GYH30_034249 [Glycine max]